MSFILDALRKSEHERERRAVPSLVERGAHGAAASRLPIVLGGIGVLLLANLLLLGYYLLRPAPRLQPAPAVAAGPPASAAASAPPPAAPRTAAGVMPRTRPLDAEADEATGPELDAPLPPRPAPGAEPALVRARPPPAEPAAAPAPMLNDLPQQTVTGLPHLSLELHVYASAPADRFVVLNGQRLHEGGTLREGPVLERITADGVVLNYRGTRFQLPRQ